MIVDTHNIWWEGYEPFAFSLDLDGVADWLRTTEMKHTSQNRSNALAGIAVSVALSSPLDEDAVLQHSLISPLSNEVR
jgi:hypothetical protein